MWQGHLKCGLIAFNQLTSINSLSVNAFGPSTSVEFSFHYDRACWVCLLWAEVKRVGDWTCQPLTSDVSHSGVMKTTIHVWEHTEDKASLKFAKINVWMLSCDVLSGEVRQLKVTWSQWCTVHLLLAHTKHWFYVCMYVFLSLYNKPK